MHRIGKTIGETVLSPLKIQMNGERNRTPARHPIVGGILL
jgi:hypothetical protein